MSSSTPLWQALPSWILSYLGRFASHSVWERNLAIHPLTDCSPQWQPIEDGATADDALWGLQSVTLHTEASSMGSPWSGDWPEQFPGQRAKLQHANECFGSPLIHDRSLAIYQTQSPAGDDWVAQCTFTPQGLLESLTLVRMHAWLPLVDMAPEEEITTPAPASTLDVPGPCKSGSTAPRTGWYEASLPHGHPMQEFYASSDIRLVYRTVGESFPTLGVRPTEDEVLVQWQWIRAE